MIEAAQVSVDCALFSIALLSLLAFLKHPMNVALVVGALNAIFVIIPALFFLYFSPIFLNYAMESLRFSTSPAPYTEARLWLLLLTGLWLVGALGSQKMAASAVAGRPLAASAPPQRPVALNYGVILGFMGLALTVFWYETRTLDLTLFHSLLPARIERGTKETSGYLAGAMLAIPTCLACIVVTVKRKPTPMFFIIALLAILAGISTGQRRNMIVIFVSVVLAALLAVRSNSRWNWRNAVRVADGSAKRRMLVLLACGALAGPIAWALRNYATQVARGAVTAASNPFDMRGFWELFFGSTAQGFPTTVLVVDMMKESWDAMFASLVFLGASPVPRILWPDKPLAPGARIEHFYSLNYSPSSFLVAELVMNFYFLAPVVALLVAYALGRFSRSLLRKGSGSNGPLYICAYAVFLPQAAVIFKNGLAIFAIYTVFWLSILWICYNLCTRNTAMQPKT